MKCGQTAQMCQRTESVSVGKPRIVCYLCGMNYLENKTSLILDIFFCVVFMPILVFLGPSYTWMAQWPLFFILTCVFLYACYFIVIHIRIPDLLIAKKYKRTFGILSLLIVINYLLSLYPLPELDFITPVLSQYQTQLRNFGVSVTLWLMFSLVMGYSLSVSFVKELYAQVLLKKQIEAQRDKAELAVFKAQISPHFLFNTLNSLYSLVIGTSEKAEEAFVKFTEILRYTYTGVEKETVPIGDEVDNIRNYIDLQKIRLNSHTRVEWDCEVDDPHVAVPPMLMVTFVENAFKYGSSTSKDCTVRIKVRLINGDLEFETANKIMKQGDKFRSDVPVGIENSRMRLQVLYPDRHSLTVSEENGVYLLRLNIRLR